MTSLITLIAYLLINTSLFNLAAKIGWGYDPGFIGPLLLAINLNIIVAVCAGAKNKQ